MNNICQITNFSDIISQGTDVQKTIYIGNTKYITILYKELSANLLTGSNTPINKLGYVCEPRGIIFPIYLEVNGEYKEFELGKTGMFEVTPEIFGEEGTEIIPKITGVRVPIGELDAGFTIANPIKFKLDYMFAIN